MDVAKGKEVYDLYRDPKVASSVVEYLDESRDVIAFSLVCKTFLHLAIRKIWTKPRLSGRSSFDSFLSTLSSPHHTVPYTSFITAINLNAFPDITDDQFRLLGACENLAHLDMRMCQSISAATLQHTFSQFHRLKAVDLEGISAITDDVVSSLARNNPNLRGVKLGNSSPDHWALSDVGVIALGDYCGDSLREVYLHLPSLSFVTSVALRCLITRCPRLQTLDIAHGRSVDDGVVRLVWQSIGQTLRKLNLAGCSELTDVMFPPPAPSTHETHPKDPVARPLPPIPKGPRHMAPSLREIDLTDCKRLTDYAIELICTNAPKLRNLNLKGCRQLTDATLHSITKLGSSLQQLNVAKLSEITDKGVDAISEACRKLANIDLSECANLTNSSVVSLSHLSRIESLRLNRNENISDVGIMSLATPGVPSSLKRVHLSFCKNVTAFSVNYLLSMHPQITFLSLSGIPDFLDDPAFLKLSKPVDRGWKPETFRVYATPTSIAKLRKVLSKRASIPNTIAGGSANGLATAIPRSSAWAQPASSLESGPAPALLAAKLERIQRPISPAQPESKSRPKDAIVGLGTGSFTRQTAAAPDMNSEKVSTEVSKKGHRKQKGRTEKGTMASLTSPEPPPPESPAGAGDMPQSRSPPSQPQPPPAPSYPPPPPPPPLAQSPTQMQAPLPSSELLETSPIPAGIEALPLRQGPLPNGAAQVHPPLTVIQKQTSVTTPGAETAMETGLVAGERGGASDHDHLSGSISSFEDLQDEGSEYDFLDNKSDLESIAASVELGSGTESGHEDDDDDIVDVGQAAARPTLGKALARKGNERRESESGVFSDDEEDFECVEIPEV